jgi:hypothetical protein
VSDVRSDRFWNTQGFLLTKTVKENLWDQKLLSDVTGCRKTQVLDCTGSTVLSFTETWLKHSTPDRDIKLSSFSVPLRKERVESSYGGVAVYIKETVHYERKTDLEINGLVCLGGAQNEKPKSSVWYFLCPSEQSGRSMA